MNISHLIFFICVISMIHFIRPYYNFDCNVYLLTGSSNILIDTGTGLNRSYLIQSIRDIIGSDGVLDKVLLTHCHFDHIGGGQSLIEVFGCEVFASSMDAEAVRTGDDTYTLSSDFDLNVPPYPVSDLDEDSIIDIGEHSLRVMSTPGHTRGGLCFYDTISSSLFSGDTIFSNGVGRTDFNGGSIISLKNSIKYLSDMAVLDLYPGHGNPTSDWPSAIRIAKQIVGD